MFRQPKEIHSRIRLQNHREDNIKNYQQRQSETKKEQEEKQKLFDKKTFNKFQQLVEKGIIVRNRNSVTLCENCLRITIGTAQDNKELLNALTSLA